MNLLFHIGSLNINAQGISKHVIEMALEGLEAELRRKLERSALWDLSGQRNVIELGSLSLQNLQVSAGIDALTLRHAIADRLLDNMTKQLTTPADGEAA